MDPIPWIERLVRVEERLAGAIARLDKLEVAAIDNPKILECLAEFTELLEESLNAGNESADAVPTGEKHSGILSETLVRRGVYAVFAIILFVISKVLEPQTPGAKLLQSIFGG